MSTPAMKLFCCCWVFFFKVCVRVQVLFSLLSSWVLTLGLLVEYEQSIRM